VLAAWLSSLTSTHSFTVKKTVSYYFIHITVAVTVAYAVTGDWAATVALSLLEPTVQAVVHFFHDRAWNARVARGSFSPGVSRAAAV
jgi:uncharacterized membrane protein